MKLFPILCVDDFYKEPDSVREFALSLPFENKEDLHGMYPGRRTELLHEVDSDFFSNFSSKLFSLLYDFKTPVKWYVHTMFQLIKPYETLEENVGWIHTDTNAIFAGVIYLTPNASKDSGTSIFRLKDNLPEDSFPVGSDKVKTDFFQGKSKEGYVDTLKKYNSRFEETVRVSNIYNRLIMFDATEHHGVTTFVTGTEPRLTQVFFVTGVESVGGAPLERCRVQNAL